MLRTRSLVASLFGALLLSACSADHDTAKAFVGIPETDNVHAEIRLREGGKAGVLIVRQSSGTVMAETPVTLERDSNQIDVKGSGFHFVLVDSPTGYLCSMCPLNKPVSVPFRWQLQR